MQLPTVHSFLELFAILIVVSITLASPIIGVTLISILLLLGNIYIRASCILYLVFMYYDWNTSDKGGRGAGSHWLRSQPIWKYFISYFPIDLVKTVDLPADRNYIIALFPHGVLSQGVFGNFCTSRSKWNTLFPQIRSKTATLSHNFYTPFLREIFMGFGMSSASSNAINALLHQSNNVNDPSNRDGYTSNAVVLVVGGAQEATYAFANTYKLVLKDRKGFVRLALENGAALVPAISFGETSVFDVIEHEPGSRWRNFQDAFKQCTRIAFVHFSGHGLLPRRHPITTVIGSPISITKVDSPSDEEIDELHRSFCQCLTQLFEMHKSKYIEDWRNVHLEII